MLVIVGEFNSGKSSFLNALLGKKYLKEGVTPTTNKISISHVPNFGVFNWLVDV
jgi:ribosome biogenesis GTPase A